MKKSKISKKFINAIIVLILILILVSPIRKFIGFIALVCGGILELIIWVIGIGLFIAAFAVMGGIFIGVFLATIRRVLEHI